MKKPARNKNYTSKRQIKKTHQKESIHVSRHMDANNGRSSSSDCRVSIM